jgi:AcrR family transcriptional regulator
MRLQNKKMMTNTQDIKEAKKTRRNKHQIRRDLLDSVGEALKKHGFANLGVNLVSEYAQVDKNTIYRHYKDFQELLTQYIEKQDYWLKSLEQFGEYKITDFKGFLSQIIVGQYETINRNRELQQLLIWELGELSTRTKAIAQQRETLSEGLIRQYEDVFKDSGIDFNAISAIIIAGVYYLVLHKEHSTFCMVDVKNEKDRIPGAIGQLVEMLFNSLEQYNCKLDIANKAKKAGIDIATISEITGIPTEELIELA